MEKKKIYWKLSETELMKKIDGAASNFNKTKNDKFKIEWYKLIHEFYNYIIIKGSKKIKKDS